MIKHLIILFFFFIIIDCYSQDINDSIIAPVIFEKKISEVICEFGFKIHTGYTNSIGKSFNHFTGSGNIATSVSAAYKAILLNFSFIGLGFGKIKTSLNEQQLKKGDNINHGAIEFSVGYSIINQPYKKLIPYIGVAQLGTTIYGKDTTLNYINNSNLTLGISLETHRKNRREQQQIYTSYKRNEGYGLIVFKFFIIPFKYNEALNGVLINFSIGFTNYIRFFSNPK